MRVVELSVFYNSGCPSCERVKQDILLPLEATQQVTLKWRDVADPVNYFPLLTAQAKYNKEYHSPTVVGPDFMLVGFSEIRAQLTKSLQQTQTMAINTPPTSDINTTITHTPRLPLVAVTAAGLIDSVNPCALATVLFFVAYLRARQQTFRKIISTGLAFCLGVYITYLGLGFGLFTLLFSSPWLHNLRQGLHWVLGIACLILGIIALYDAWRTRAGHSSAAANTWLKLPLWARALMHKHIRQSPLLNPSVNPKKSGTLALSSLLISGIILGFIVSLIEGVCTGQIYLPTIVYLTKTEDSLSAFFLLLWYNFLFILPLLVLLFLAAWGINQKTMEAWFYRNLSLGKALLALFFFAFGILMFVSA